MATVARKSSEKVAASVIEPETRCPSRDHLCLVLTGLSEYELQRLDTIARNEAFLKSLGIDEDKKELVKPKVRAFASIR